MIKIKDYIFDEDIITEIHKIDDVLNVYIRNGNIDYIKDATFEDIEWNYGNNISESLSYDLAKARIEELEEENKKLKEELEDINVSKDNYVKLVNKVGELTEKIDKTIGILETLKGSARWERHLYEIDNLIKILKGE